MKATGITDVGKVRKVNEDYYITCNLSQNAVVAVVCDGVGGEKAGDVASKVACEEIIENIEATYKDSMDDNAVKNLLLSASMRANVILHRMSQADERYKKMGCTLVLVLVRGQTAYIVSAGDSRVYLINSESANQITVDHTMAQFLYEQGELDSEGRENYPQKNIITRALGVEDEISLDYNEIYLTEEDRILMCTDGLYKYISDIEIMSFAMQQSGMEKMVTLANERGGSDNITVVLIKLYEERN